MYENLSFTTYDALTDKATMMLRGGIGIDFTAEAFLSEMAYLERSGVKNIDILINSSGGIVTEAYSIFSAIVSSKAYVTTYACGIAASSASWIFLAGNKAVMMDYSFLFVHNPSSSDNSAKGKEMVEYMRQSIVTILAKRTGNTPETIADLMDNDTLINATQALAMGFASEVQETDVLVDTVEANVENIGEMFRVFNQVMPKNKNFMTEEVNVDEVTNEVEAVVEAVVEETPVVEEVVAEQVEAPVEEVETEEAVESETEEVKEEVKVEEVTNFAELTDQLTTITNEYKVAQTEIAELTKVVNELRAIEAGRELETTRVRATDLVTNAVEAGKIDAGTKDSWVTLAVANYAVVEDALKAMKMNKPGVDVTNFLVTDKVQEAPVMNIREMEMKDPAGLERIYKNDRALYDKMHKDYYGNNQ